MYNKAYIKIFIISVILIFSCTKLKADYQFNNITASLSSITDSSLAKDIKGEYFSANLSGEIANSFILSGGISATTYDEKVIQSILVDYAAHSVDMNLAKYREFKNETKVLAYIGLVVMNTETVIGNIVNKDSDTALSYGAGLIAPINNQIDFLVNLDINTLFNDTVQAFSIGLSFDLDDIAAIETSFTQQEDLEAVSLAIRFNYD